MKTENIQEILIKAARAAISGEMDDSTRVMLYRLAMTVAAAEFHRIESSTGGTVSPEVLALLQQIALLCDEDVDAERLFGHLLEENDVA